MSNPATAPRSAPTSPESTTSSGAPAARPLEGRLRIAAEVATVWTRPDAPRAVDALAVADRPDVAGWLDVLDSHAADDRRGDRHGRGRLGLHGRIVTQALAGEPVLVVDPGRDPEGWVRVLLPGQPSSQDERGYPGWIRRAHLGTGSTPEAGAPTTRATAAPATAAGVLELARTHLGLRYLWGGTCALGLDCSGLVHLVWRHLGAVVPRDADDQQRVAHPVPRGGERPGDLYFFADQTGAVDHVGIVVSPGVMIDAAESRGTLAEGPLTPARSATLYAVGRLPLPPGR